MLLHLPNDVVTGPCKISPHCFLSLSLSHPKFLLDVPLKTSLVEGEVLQFLLPQWEPANTFSTVTHEKHCGQLTKYQGARGDRPLDQAGPKPYRAQHSVEPVFHGSQNDAHLSWETL
jgi:hypothetical protein